MGSTISASLSAAPSDSNPSLFASLLDPRSLADAPSPRSQADAPSPRSQADAPSLDPSRMTVRPNWGLHGEYLGPDARLPHSGPNANVRLGQAPNIPRRPSPPTSALAAKSDRNNLEYEVSVPVEGGVSIRVRRRAGGKRVGPRRVEPLASTPSPHKPANASNHGESTRESKGDVFEPERPTLFPTVKPVRREPEQPRRIERRRSSAEDRTQKIERRRSNAEDRTQTINPASATPPPTPAKKPSPTKSHTPRAPPPIRPRTPRSSTKPPP